MRYVVVCCSIVLLFCGGCLTVSQGPDAISVGSYDLPDLIIKGKPVYRDGYLLFKKGIDLIEVPWMWHDNRPPLRLDPGKRYTFILRGKEITESEEIEPGEVFFIVSDRYYLHSLWLEDKLLLADWDPECVREERGLTLGNIVVSMTR